MTLAAGDSLIETQRLLLRRVAPDDLPFFVRIHSDPEVARYIGYGRPRSAEETKIWLDRLLETYERFERGPLAVVRKSDNALVGRCGISYLEIERAPADGGDPVGYFAYGEAPPGISTRLERELAYTFDREAWGHGF